MPLWTMTDANIGSPIYTASQFNLAPNQANANLLFSNTTANAVVTGMTVGVFGVDASEVDADANGHGYHAGWVLRKVGSGGRAGRVTYETLVAASTITRTTDGDDTAFPDYRIVITTQPSSNTSNGDSMRGNTPFTVVASSLPTGATLTYKWQRAYAGAPNWADVPNTAGVLFNNTSPTLTANAQIANGNVFRVMVSNLVSGAANVYSANATLYWQMP